MAGFEEPVGRLVLVGAGHAHLFVLEQLAAGRFPAADVTLLSPYPHHLYSGMLGGLVSGRYRREDAYLDLPARIVCHWVGDETSPSPGRGCGPGGEAHRSGRDNSSGSREAGASEPDSDRDRWGGGRCGDRAQHQGSPAGLGPDSRRGGSGGPAIAPSRGSPGGFRTSSCPDSAAAPDTGRLG